MSGTRYRRRGTAIVETDRGILVTAGRSGPFILPGGGANRGESRFMAALRELTEETGLLPYFAEIIFKHKGEVSPTLSGRYKYQDHHTVCLIKASGNPRPGGGDAQKIGYYYPGCGVWISKTTKAIIERYYEWKMTNKQPRNSNMIDEDDNVEDVGDNILKDQDSE